MIYKYKQHKNLKNYSSKKGEKNILNQIRDKLKKDTVIITRADKGNVIVSEVQEYQEKLGDFINKNNFYSLNQDLTKSFQKEMSINKHCCFKYREGNVMCDGEI